MPYHNLWIIAHKSVDGDEHYAQALFGRYSLGQFRDIRCAREWNGRAGDDEMRRYTTIFHWCILCMILLESEKLRP
jgi:hypothetical protein